MSNCGSVRIEDAGVSLGEEWYAKARRCEILDRVFSQHGVDVFADDAVDQMLGKCAGTLCHDRKAPYENFIEMADRYDKIRDGLREHGVDLDNPQQVLEMANSLKANIKKQ